MPRRAATAPLAGEVGPASPATAGGEASAVADTLIVDGEPVPISAMTVALLGSPSLVTLKHDTEGPTIKVRIVRACGDWIEGDEPNVHADYGHGLISNGLAMSR